MNRYRIYCTPEQTKMAMELGAPIETRWDYDAGNSTPFDKEISIGFRHYADIPTAEQMIGWLEDKRIDCFVEKKLNWKIPYFAVARANEQLIFSKYYPTRKEAILAAIDAALEYLKTLKV